MLTAAAAAGSPRPNLAARRAAFRKLMELSDHGEVIGGVEERALRGPADAMRVRIYTPVESRAELFPALIYYHGGGLVSGSLDTHDGLCRALANATGYRLLSVDYRLAPEHKFPAAVTDACAAAEWIVMHAEEFGINRSKIAVGGDSAGATLAAVVCQWARAMPGIRLAAQLLLCPITDFAGMTRSRNAYAEGFLLETEEMDKDLEKYVPAGVDATDPRISPLRAADFANLPPAFIHTAEFDPLHDEGLAYANRLAAAGVEVHYTCHPGMIHLFYGMTRVVPYARTALSRIGTEMRTALG